ncbi:hypothetical protein A0H81_01379 [Grifola frondosa]|uniref:Uncharacterized protein n=1 Tax=Grifola frondosa TaxID=5627 RepID=A0A1C7MPM9_GRIFR|nr:hypothetical protein A0H81_01379 [Grifola frondosa]
MGMKFGPRPTKCPKCSLVVKESKSWHYSIAHQQNCTVRFPDNHTSKLERNDDGFFYCPRCPDRSRAPRTIRFHTSKKCQETYLRGSQSIHPREDDTTIAECQHIPALPSTSDNLSDDGDDIQFLSMKFTKDPDDIEMDEVHVKLELDLLPTDEMDQFSDWEPEEGEAIADDIEHAPVHEQLPEHPLRTEVDTSDPNTLPSELQYPDDTPPLDYIPLPSEALYLPLGHSQFVEPLYANTPEYARSESQAIDNILDHEFRSLSVSLDAPVSAFGPAARFVTEEHPMPTVARASCSVKRELTVEPHREPSLDQNGLPKPEASPIPAEILRSASIITVSSDATLANAAPPPCPIRAFLDSLTIPLGGHANVFLRNKFTTEQHLDVLCQCLDADLEFLREDFDLPEWLALKIGLRERKKRLLR